MSEVTSTAGRIGAVPPPEFALYQVLTQPVRWLVRGVALVAFTIFATYWIVLRYLGWLIVPAIWSMADPQANMPMVVLGAVVGVIVVNIAADRFARSWLRDGEWFRLLVLPRHSPVRRVVRSRGRLVAEMAPVCAVDLSDEEEDHTAIACNPATGLPLVRGTQIDVSGHGVGSGTPGGYD